MARINYNEFINQNQQQFEQPDDYIPYFFLRNDGDDAIVRFMDDSPVDFEIIATHQYDIGGKSKTVNCLRTPREDISKCPMCAEGAKLSYRFYIHLIQYEKDESGKIVATPRIWERGMSYANMLKQYCADYSPISSYLFRIKRNGKAGSVDTTYSIIPLNPAVYSAADYPVVENPFTTYSVVGKQVLDLSYERMNEIVNGKPEAEESYTDSYIPKAEVNTSSQQFESAPQTYSTTYDAPPQRSTFTVDSSQNEGEALRPRRFSV